MSAIIDEIKGRVDIVSKAKGIWKLHKIGTDVWRVIPCPGCGSKKGFTISGKKQNYTCYSCGIYGDVFGLLQLGGQYNNFKDCLDDLARETGVKLRDLSEEDRKKYEAARKKKERRQSILREAAIFYYKQLETSKKALGYLQDKRNRSEEFILSGRYGFSGGKSISTYLIKKEYTIEEILESGLMKRDKDNPEKLYDTFGRDYIIYTSKINGKVSDLYGINYWSDPRKITQLLKEKKLNKYLFYNQDALYHKKKIILVEGQEDAHSVLECGLNEVGVVAMVGSLSKDQVEALSRLEGREIFLAFDHDGDFGIKTGDVRRETGDDKKEKVISGNRGRSYYAQLIPVLMQNNQVKVCIWDNCVTKDENGKTPDIDDFLRKSSRETGDGRRESLGKILAKAFDPVDYILNVTGIAGLSGQEQYNWLEAIGNLIKEFPAGLRNIYGKKISELTEISQKDIVNLAKKEDAKGSYDDIKVYKKNNCYYFSDQDKTKKLSEFVIELHRYIEQENTYIYEISMVNPKGKQSRKIFVDAEERVNNKKFRKLCAGQGEFYFRGNDNDLIDMWKAVSTEYKDVPVSRYMRIYGYSYEHDLWIFGDSLYKDGKRYEADENGEILIGKDGYCSSGVNVYSFDRPKIKVYKDDEYRIKVIENFWGMMDYQPGELYPRSFKGFMLMGFAAANFWLPEILEISRKFPFMQIYGPSGDGKTEVVKLLMRIFGFSKGSEDWNESTAVGISMMLEQMSCLPSWFEEFNIPRNVNDKYDKKVAILKTSYNFSGTGKGGLNDTRSSRKVNGTVIVTGQDQFVDRALKSRTDTLYKTRPCDESTKCYQWLSENQDDLSGLADWMLRNKSKARKKELIEYITYYENLLREHIKSKDMKVDERIVYNYSRLAGAFRMWGYEEYEAEFVEWLCAEIIEAKEQVEKEDIVYRFFENISNVIADKATSIERIEEIYNMKDGEVHLRLSRLFSDWQKYSRQRGGLGEYLTYSSMKNYLKNDTRAYWAGDGRNYFNVHPDKLAAQHRCITLKYDKLPDNIREIVDGWE